MILMKRETLLLKPLKNLYPLAQKYFNRYIRLRDLHKGCITCTGQVQEAGHFEHGGNNKYSFWCDFSEENLNGQCTKCNNYESGKLNVYAEKLEKMYGYGIIEKLNALKWKSDEWTKEDLVDIIESSKENIKKLLTIN